VNARTHYFRDEQDNRTVVVTVQLPTGRYKALIVEGEPQEGFFGYGASRIGAIADLNAEIAREMEGV
jgi:hypothetical protein